MAHGHTTSLTIRLTPVERHTLLAWQRSTAISAGLARHGRILLFLSDGIMSITDIAATVGSAVALSPRERSVVCMNNRRGRPTHQEVATGACCASTLDGAVRRVRVPEHRRWSMVEGYKFSERPPSGTVTVQRHKNRAGDSAFAGPRSPAPLARGGSPSSGARPKEVSR